MSSRGTRVLIVGGGMVGHELIQRLLDQNAEQDAGWQITLLGEEPHAPYDRIHLGRMLDGGTPAELALAQDGYVGVDVRLGDPVTSIDRAARRVTTAAGVTLDYDWLVLATGSRAFVPPVAGMTGAGRFVYRTIEDAQAIDAAARALPAGSRAVVIGGGLLGLEAGGALAALGVGVDVVEVAPRLLPVQVDDGGGAALRRLIEARGLAVHTSTQIVGIDGDDGAFEVKLASGATLPAAIVVVAAGIRPRDELARACGLAVGARGGVAIDDACRTEDPAIFAVGECAAWRDQVFGLVGPGNQMAGVVAARLAGDLEAVFTGGEAPTRLKLVGVEVASFGDAHERTGGCKSVVVVDTERGSYRKVVIDPATRRVLGGVLVGDASDLGRLAGLIDVDGGAPANPVALLAPELPATGATPPRSAQVCTCNNVTRGAICDAIAGGACDVGALKKCTRAGTSCGGCVPAVTDLLRAELAARGLAAPKGICEHFAFSRQELAHLIRVRKIKAFDDVLKEHGRGLGCEICKPAIASILASTWSEHVLDAPRLHLQDTNDRFLANLQRDGTYSVVPRVPGGEITPAQLIVIGQVAQKYDLYTKITGGQRIDLFGATVDQLPLIWAELVAAGFESGHAYGKAVRTVKTCVGSTWCRYGVQDSVGAGIRLEQRYKGLRAPHKLKLAVSGCTRECAEAQSKDVGVIATERGYNLYVCGNGGAQPRHASLFAVDLDEPTLVRYIDRFLMFYIRTADRLQRTARWLEAMEGGLDYLKAVVIDDSLGIAAELEAEMATLVGAYQCEWRAVLEDPEKLERFRTYVNRKESDDDLHYVRERGQRRPAYAHERPRLRVVD